MNCEHCGTPLEGGVTSCTVCGTPVQAVDYADPAEAAAPERMGLGIVGALIGAVIGGASIVLLSQLGFVAAISGVLLAVCTLKGYELLGKQLSRRGIIFCLILMIVTPVIADAIDWAIIVHDAWKDYGASLFECLIIIPDLLADGTIPMDTYLGNLGMLYLFVALGGFGTMKNALKK